MIKTGKAGSGTYGRVYNAETTDKYKSRVAVKRNIVDASIDFSGSIKELDLLNRLKGHPYIVKLISVSYNNPFSMPNSPIAGGNDFNFKDDYLHFIFEQAKTSGHSLIYDKNTHVSYLKLAMVQMFLAIEYMHAKEVIHRDLKPANLLWFRTSDNKAAIKLCDFGLAKSYTKLGPMTPKVVTCWYRAPEICSGDTNYGYSSDIWSAACILYEMVSKRALLFGYPDDDIKMLSKIIGLIPNTEYDDLYKITKGNKIKLTAEASPRVKPSIRDLINLPDVKVFNCYPAEGAKYDDFIDLLENILVINPEKRYTATQVLDHKFFEPYRSVIKWSRKSFPPVKSIPKTIKIIYTKERYWACKVAFMIYNAREYLSWYKHRIIFQSIDMFDRYLVFLDSNSDKKIESKHQGRYITRYQTELRYVVCLYMCIKYFTTLRIPISFGQLATDNYKTPKAMLEAEEFEKKMIRDVLKLNIYRETIYESSSDKNIDEHQIRNLLYMYGTINSDLEITPRDLLDKLLKYKK